MPSALFVVRIGSKEANTDARHHLPRRLNRRGDGCPQPGWPPLT
jgi:hypothetical protein